MYVELIECSRGGKMMKDMMDTFYSIQSSFILKLSNFVIVKLRLNY